MIRIPREGRKIKKKQACGKDVLHETILYPVPHRHYVFSMLKEEGKIDDDIIKKLMDWRHSGFSVHNKARIARDFES